MTLKEIYCQTDKIPVISFETFPPKNDEDGAKLEKLLHHLEILKKYNPAFVSVTYGAGGTTQNTSLNILKKIQKDLGLNVMPHFTCVNNTKEQVRKYLKEIQDLGIKNILALRGDIPEGVEQEHFDFHYANNLVEFIRAETQLSIGVAGYPECHIDCEDASLDLKNLKRKVDAGADVVYTQMFFDNDKLFSYIESARKVGVEVPIIPGILPIMSYPQLERMLSMARVSVPVSLMAQLEKYKDNAEDIKKVGIEFASCQCQQLIEAKIEGLHFFTLNTSSSLSKIMDNLSLANLSHNF